VRKTYRRCSSALPGSHRSSRVRGVPAGYELSSVVHAVKRLGTESPGISDTNRERLGTLAPGN
jgi:hypothetical protein